MPVDFSGPNGRWRQDVDGVNIFRAYHVKKVSILTSIAYGNTQTYFTRGGSLLVFPLKIVLDSWLSCPQIESKQVKCQCTNIDILLCNGVGCGSCRQDPAGSLCFPFLLLCIQPTTVKDRGTSSYIVRYSNSLIRQVAKTIYRSAKHSV